MRFSSTVAALIGAAALSLTASLPASAAEIRAFEQKAFTAAQTAGKPIVVDITASWCPTCAKQKPIIQSLADSDKFKDMTIFTVDFDRQKDVVRALGATQQSTLIAYRGTKETRRSIGDTKASSIEQLFQSAKTN
ncbi:thioredoxin family protein [Rhizobium lemnae]|uniref:Thioredoxin family protein n=1 Tax=Rhizobium lemnae TaxID=1214924 RepID=A0ABV8E6S2_9HYPH|nr:thioredoxin family protein [Rhizobium lemnae]MCJ8508322.1 thioredoxin family protein [Rhizobium lemnae]